MSSRHAVLLTPSDLCAFAFPPRSRHHRRRDHKPALPTSSKMRLYIPPIKCDARNPFGIRIYENCRVSPVPDSLFSLFVPRAFHNSFAIKRFRTLSKNCRVWGGSSYFGTRHSFTLSGAEGPLITPHCTQVLSFHTLVNSFAPAKIATLFFSCDSELFRKNSRGWGYPSHREFFARRPPPGSKGIPYEVEKDWRRSAVTGRGRRFLRGPRSPLRNP